MFAIIVESKEKKTLVKLGCSQEYLDQFLQQYEEGYIVFRGMNFPPNQIYQVKIFEHNETVEELKAKAHNELLSYAQVGISTLSVDPEIKAAYLGNEVTDNLITRAPGSRIQEKKVKKIDCGRVFVVHGHDRVLKVDVERFLFSVGLEPIVLHRQPNAGKTVIEKFEENSDVKYVFILLTPDDWAYTDGQYKQDLEKDNLKARARQNVIFEWGFFTAKLGRQSVCVLNKGVEVPSDLAGFIYESVGKDGLDPIEERLKKELTEAGLKLSKP